MSQENVELTHQAYHAFNRRDLASLLALIDADAEAVPRLAAMEGVFHGHEGIRRWWKTLLAAWPDYQVEVVEVRDLGHITLGNVEVVGSRRRQRDRREANGLARLAVAAATRPSGSVSSRLKQPPSQQ